jgi:hypothetical protein
MRAELLIRERHVLTAEMFAEIVVWRVPRPLRASRHDLKYRLALIVRGECVLRYDNEAGKGDHRHLDDEETDYAFTTHERLVADCWNDVETWTARR